MKLCKIHKDALELRNINWGFPLPVVEQVAECVDCDYCESERDKWGTNKKKTKV